MLRVLVLCAVASLICVCCGGNSNPSQPSAPESSAPQSFEPLPAIHNVGDSGVVFELRSVKPDRGASISTPQNCIGGGPECFEISYAVSTTAGLSEALRPSTPPDSAGRYPFYNGFPAITVAVQVDSSGIPSPDQTKILFKMALCYDPSPAGPCDGGMTIHARTSPNYAAGYIFAFHDPQPPTTLTVWAQQTNMVCAPYGNGTVCSFPWIAAVASIVPFSPIGSTSFSLGYQKK